MRIPRSIAIGIVALFCLSPTLRAQCSEREIAIMEAGGRLYPAPAQLKPYTITFKSITVQKLANGVTITHESHSKEAHDSSGRWYTESELQQDSTITTINDPINHTIINWDSNSKNVTVFHQPDLDSPPPPGTVVVRVERPASRPCRTGPNGTQIEDLGKRTIQGMTTTGTRITHTIKPGSEDNDLAFNVIVEVWYSPDLNRNLLKIYDDPRTGTQTLEATAVQLGEPDPSLFQIPEGCTVHDEYPGLRN